jgi:hypothetical protein
MAKRPRPDIDQVREALRERDEAAEDEDTPTAEPDEDTPTAEPDEDEDEETAEE